MNIVFVFSFVRFAFQTAVHLGGFKVKKERFFFFVWVKEMKVSLHSVTLLKKKKKLKKRRRRKKKPMKTAEDELNLTGNASFKFSKKKKVESANASENAGH